MSTSEKQEFRVVLVHEFWLDLLGHFAEATSRSGKEVCIEGLSAADKCDLEEYQENADDLIKTVACMKEDSVKLAEALKHFQDNS